MPKPLFTSRFFDGSRTLAWIFMLNIGMTVLLWVLRALPVPVPDAFLLMAGSPQVFITRPWTLLTYMFTQVDVLNLLFNLLWIWCLGRIVLLGDGDRRLAAAYIGGGVLGGLLFLAGATVADGGFRMLAGPSAALLGITVFAAVRRPDMPLNLFLIGTVKLKWVAAVFVAIILLQSGTSGSQLAHLGGIIFGAVYALMLRLRTAPKRRSEERPRHKARPTPPEAVNRRQAIDAMRGRLSDTDRLDELLDKVRLSGYDSLSPAEKRELNAISSRL